MSTRSSDLTFSSETACALAGVSYRQMHYWCRRMDLFSPAVCDPGQGNPWRWSAADVRVLILLGRLNQVRIDTAVLRAAMPALHRACLDYDGPVADRWAVISASGLPYIVDAFDLPSALARRSCWVVPFAFPNLDEPDRAAA